MERQRERERQLDKMEAIKCLITAMADIFTALDKLASSSMVRTPRQMSDQFSFQSHNNDKFQRMLSLNDPGELVQHVLDYCHSS